MKRPIDSRWRLVVPLVLLALLLVAILFDGPLEAQTLDPVGDPDLGDYTVGLYANPDGTGDEIRLGKDDTTFTVYLGLSGDPVHTFSGLALRLRFPDYLDPAGAVRWTPIPGLKESELIFGDGGQVLFLECATQPAGKPFVLGRLEVAVDPRFREATLAPEGHRQHGLSLQLCQVDGMWPKRNADAVGVHVVRSLSFWDKLTSLFD